ncbi:MAG: hypothetical protein HYU42_09905 [Candidatus Rokubacteria bacterium]|nr:hypothetical protein [Candidatus Rokubacteria bacterium]MBI2198894.1 hypothetical protein [Candidatus Rokubacteria bacterium]MBI3105944.1 hypothetical protein [Candidatus Rokubacteria bacterium]
MTLALAALLPLVGLAVWTFVRFRPRSGSAVAVRAYNVGVLLVAVAGCAWTAAHFYRITGQSVDRAWWPVLATLASLLVVSGVLLAGTALRNFVVFAGRRRR